MMQRQRLTRWLFAFSTINFLMLVVMALCFLMLVPTAAMDLVTSQSKLLLMVSFVSLGLIGQIGALGVLLSLLLWLLVVALPYRTIVLPCAIGLMTLLLFLVGLDFVAYQFIGYHLTTTFWDVLFSGAFSQVVVLGGLEWTVLVVGFLAVAAIEVSLALWLYKRNGMRRGAFRYTASSLLILMAFGFSYALYFEPVRTDRVVPQLAQVIPFFEQVSRESEHVFLAHSPQKLHYPLHTLSFKSPTKPLNIVMIVIDTWRANMFNSTDTPSIARFAEQSLRFTNHYSGGNFTRPGIFSLLYGLTPNYWQSILDHKRSPLLIQQLLHDHYQTEVLASASLHFPDFVDTAFRQVPQAWHDTTGSDSSERDATITQEFINFLNTRNTQQPFFGFLFYDEVHDWCGSSQRYAHPFQPAIATCNRLMMGATTNPLPYVNRYKNAVHYDDGLVGDVLTQLTAHDLLKNTIVIITADHGNVDEMIDKNGIVLTNHSLNPVDFIFVPKSDDKTNYQLRKNGKLSD
ncbi:MAG: hypothetical protein COB66_09080, partial [Coxiella sp. (in: Bacteria)]